MPLIFRVMKKAQDDKPMIGPSATSLGVRVPKDIQPDKSGNVVPNTGGMSVSPALISLPALLVPRRLRHLVPGAQATGSNLCIWRMGSGPFEASQVAPGLALRPDKPNHGTVQPDKPMPLHEYQDALVATRSQWVIDETGG